MTMLVATVIVHDRASDALLLIQRAGSNVFGAGLWDLPGGKREPDEPVTATAVREVAEETGVQLRPESLEVAHVIHGRRGTAAPDGWLTVVFTTHEWTGTPHNREPEKHARVEWVPASRVPTAFVPGSRAALDGYLGDGPRLTLRGWAG
ncbi:NUDIX domain-containing protein [Streptomyces sp. NPDC088923]|uniref:NUDIX domain-containing protein n=1 Tax=Streptomyces sp. NPDC088923 TaxID=3365913 RepID=UPI00380B136E